MQKSYTNALINPIFNLISEAAEELSMDCYVIGGFVRDFFLERTVPTDIDIVAIGSGIELAEKVASMLDGKPQVSVFKNFGTAMIRNEELELEFVGARKESYQRNSRKPIVEDGTLEDDQKRRDFTINALALSLNSKNFGTLLDPFDGVTDLEHKIIKNTT